MPSLRVVPAAVCLTLGVVPAAREATQVEVRVAVQRAQRRLKVGQVHERVVVHLG